MCDKREKSHSKLQKKIHHFNNLLPNHQSWVQIGFSPSYFFSFMITFFLVSVSSQTTPLICKTFGKNLYRLYFSCDMRSFCSLCGVCRVSCALWIMFPLSGFMERCGKRKIRSSCSCTCTSSFYLSLDYLSVDCCCWKMVEKISDAETDAAYSDMKKGRAEAEGEVYCCLQP